MTAAVNGSSAPPVVADWPPAGTARSPAAAASAPTPAAVPALPDPVQQAQVAARQLQQFLQQAGHDMKFIVDKSTGLTIVRIYNSSTGELVRQIPSEEIVRIAELLRADAGRATVDVHV
jgi:flagellar protein FlaG